MVRRTLVAFLAFCLLGGVSALTAAEYEVTETDEEIRIVTPQLEAAVRKQGYVSGVARQSFLDKKTGFRDPGFGLDIADFIMEPGSDEEYRERMSADHGPYTFNNMVHGKRPKRLIEGPQICTQARQLEPVVIRGKDFVAVKQQYQYKTAAPGRKTGSVWSQVLVFPMGKRYFVSMDRIDSVNESDAMFLRIDMPGHLRHKRGDTFSKIYLSYHGTIPAAEFFEDFPPDGKFNYRRDQNDVPERFIRACQLRDPETGGDGPWLAGMTLEPTVVHEGWCHQRGYVCMIEEFGGRSIKPGESFSAAFIVGYFDSIDEMHQVYDQYRGHTGLEVTEEGWKLVK
ncbi:MAG: hypothetical protein ABIK89_23015 [Planctomycetota bacterium]